MKNNQTFYPPGHITRIFQWNEQQAKDASGNIPIIIKKIEEPNKKKTRLT